MKKIKLSIISNPNDIRRSFDFLFEDSSYQVIELGENQTNLEESPHLIIFNVVSFDHELLIHMKRLKQRFVEIKILVISTDRYCIPFQEVSGYLPYDCSKKDICYCVKKIVESNKKCFFYRDSVASCLLVFEKQLLTKRELEIIGLLYEENNLHQIADKLLISKNTVESHKKNIYRKLLVNNVIGLFKRITYFRLISTI